MFYVDISNQLNFLITVCLSFSIFSFALWFRSSGIFPRVFGISFIIPLLMETASFLARKKAVSDTFSELVIPTLLLSLLLLLVLKPSSSNLGIYIFCLVSLPLILILLVNKISFIQNLSTKPLYILTAIVILLVANMFLLKREEGAKGYLFWALLPLAASNALEYYIKEGVFAYLVPLLKIAAFYLFTIYFYNAFYRNLVRKTEEAEKKITRVNRSLDMEVKKRMLEIERINQNLVNISKLDSLSNALNKRAILDAIDNLTGTKGKNEFSILMFDIDNFKIINDSYGHVTGDKCIITLAAIAKANLREFDLIGRYGGDEFIIVLPGTNMGEAYQIAERFRKKVELSEKPHYTISIGISTYPKDGISVEDLLEVADKSLYKSKDNGRNTITYMGSNISSPP